MKGDFGILRNPNGVCAGGFYGWDITFKITTFAKNDKRVEGWKTIVNQWWLFEYCNVYDVEFYRVNNETPVLVAKERLRLLVENDVRLGVEHKSELEMRRDDG